MKMKTSMVSKIQAIFRGFNYRKNNLPNAIKRVKQYLEQERVVCSKSSDDGRTNSCFDELKVIKILAALKEFQHRLWVPEKRHWFDIAIKDYRHGWLPINIKSTTTKNSDNIGNLTTCVYALTNYDINIRSSYQNGPMSRVYIDCIKNEKFNRVKKRDYYFIVMNKNNGHIIANSLKGLVHLTPNINNLPFQINWSRNPTFAYKSLKNVIDMVNQAFITPKPSWRETFLKEMRGLK